MGHTQEDVDAMVSKLELDGSKISTKVEGRAFVNGEFVEAKSGEWLTSLNPATNKEVARVASCDVADADAAVSAARSAFESGVWSELAATERRNVLLKLADSMEKNVLELSVIETVEAGKPVNDHFTVDIPMCVETLKYHAEAINKVYGQVSPTTTDKLGMIVREPVGVCGLIVPWNFPLLVLVSKLAPALATGNSVVLKPSEMTSLTALLLAKLALEAGVPPGVFNVVPGYGPKVGAAIAGHMDVDMCGFTGSNVVGRSILKASAESNMKRCALELGGKSPVIVFDDCCEEDDDETLEKFVTEIFYAAFANQSENCMCGSRLLLQRGIKDRLLKKLIGFVESGDYKIGDPLRLDTFNGPMISTQHMDKVMGYVEKGKAEGAKLLIGGERVSNAFENSGDNFVAMTIFDEVDNSMSIARNEIFGPVLSVLTFDTEEEAVKMANDTVYGLFGAVFTSNVNRAHRVSRRVRAGVVSVNNCGEGDDTVPFAGYKQSGFAGCDKSVLAFDQYQEVKTVWYDVDVPGRS